MNECTHCINFKPTSDGRRMNILTLHFDSGMKNAASFSTGGVEVYYCPSCGRSVDKRKEEDDFNNDRRTN